MFIYCIINEKINPSRGGLYLECPGRMKKRVCENKYFCNMTMPYQDSRIRRY